MVTLGEMLHEWAGHDLMHTVQGERGDPAAVHRRLWTLETVFFRPCRHTFTAQGMTGEFI